MSSSATNDVRLTSFSRGAGCGCKLSADELQAALSAMSVAVPTRPEVLVGLGTSDDAAVVSVGHDVALVQTLDFFTPIVDDPFLWGRIAATNALSDVYAMGGRPLSALAIVAWPRDQLGWDLLGRVLDGGASVLAEAGCALVGGHSIDDNEPKYGLSVTGLVHPDHVLTNAGGRPGDVLVLTKPLGVGVITTAMKRGLSTPDVEDAAVEAMVTRNDRASEAAVEAGCRAATDVTGFGLMGHLTELVRASRVTAEIDVGAVPVIDGVADLIDQGAVPGGTTRNLAAAVDVDWGPTAERDRLVLCDAQTSGGLLIAVPADALGAFRSAVDALDAGPVFEIGRLGGSSAAPDEALQPLIQVR